MRRPDPADARAQLFALARDYTPYLTRWQGTAQILQPEPPGARLHPSIELETYNGALAGTVSRRRLLRTAVAGGGVAAAAAATFLFRRPRPVEGGFVDRGHVVGHRIRDGQPFPASPDRVRIPAVIVGGGIAGLSAAWWMRRLGFDEFVLLELEDSAGGNSRSGQNSITAYPWAAHYVPVPDRRIPLVEELFSELGVLQDGRWDPRHLSREPLSRLFADGAWSPGIEPGDAASRADHDQFDRFWDRMDYYRQGGEFTIPIRPPQQSTGLDRISMKSWMVAEGFFHDRLRWYIDYCCRDDYGCSYEQASAWAGIHYFAARPEDEAGFLTWPEGNGWIVNRLTEQLGPWLRTGLPVRRISKAGRRLEVITEQVTYECDAVVFAAPTFLTPFLAPELAAELPPLGDFAYSPWYTANLVVEQPPREAGAPPAWENIIYDSAGLGYVIATHQTASASATPSVWTYYHAMAQAEPRDARASLLEMSWEERKEEVLTDLEQAHPDIRDCVTQVDIMRLGHGMIRPTPGTLTSVARQRLANWNGPIQFANSDLSGISIFEEAQFRGVRAAERVLARLGYRNLEYADA